MLWKGREIFVLLIGISLATSSFGQECRDGTPRFGDLYPDPFAVPQRETFILGSRLPTEGYLLRAYCSNGELHIFVMDTDLRDLWHFFIVAPLPDPLDQPCADEAGESVRSGAREYLEQGACGRVQGIVCVGKGFVTKLYEYLYTGNRQIGEQLFALGAHAELYALYEPETTYLRQMVSVYGSCPTGDCEILNFFYQTVRNAGTFDALSFDKYGRPLTDLLSSGRVPYDRSLYDPDVPPDFRYWVESALQTCEP